MLQEIKSMDELPKEGKCVLLMKLGWRAPCQKIYNTLNGVAGRTENIPFYWIELTSELQQKYMAYALPVILVFKDGEIIKRMNGHHWGEFEIEANVHA